jgi:RNA polymerase sigma-B factor
VVEREDVASIAAARRAPANLLVESHRHLADRLASRFANRGQPLEDLKQVAYLGLVTAARRFDAARGVQFATFARATVLGELKKHFRDHAWTVRVPRPVQELYLAVRPAVEDLTQSLGRAPTAGEIAARVGATVEDVVEALDAVNALHVDSLDRPRPGDEDGHPFDRGAVDPGFFRVEERSWLVPALAALPPRERHILELRFVEGLPQSAIAAKVGISQMHVSRLLAKSLAILRASAPVA